MNDLNSRNKLAQCCWRRKTGCMSRTARNAIGDAAISGMSAAGLAASLALHLTLIDLSATGAIALTLSG
jgi:hypothetical protein